MRRRGGRVRGFSAGAGPPASPELQRQQERHRGLLRTVVRAWREEADGRCARSKRVALLSGQQVEQGAPAGRLGADCLPTMHTTMQPRKPTKKEEEEEGKATAEARRWQGR